MKRKHLALLLVAAMTVTSVDATALVSAADFSAEVTEEAVQDEELDSVNGESADVEIADEESESSMVDSEEPDVSAVEEDTAEDEISAQTEAADFSSEVKDDTAVNVGDEDDEDERITIPSEEATALELDQSYSVEITQEKREQWFSFTPSESGSYMFFSEYADDEYSDPVVSLYDSDGIHIDEFDDICSGDYNFAAVYTLEKDKTYYYCAKSYSEEVDHYKVSMIRTPSIKEITFTSENIQKEYVQNVDKLDLIGCDATLTYSNGLSTTRNITNNDDDYDGAAITEFYVYGLKGEKYTLEAVKEDPTDTPLTVKAGTFSECGAYKVRVKDEDGEVLPGAGFEINVISKDKISSLNIGENENVTCPIHGCKWYKFIPSVTGKYYLDMRSDYPEVYDESFSEIDRETYKNYMLIAGNTYYLKLYYGFYINETQKTDTGSVTIKLQPELASLSYSPLNTVVTWGEADNPGAAIEGILTQTDVNDEPYDMNVQYSVSLYDGEIFGGSLGDRIVFHLKDSNGESVYSYSWIKPGQYTYWFESGDKKTEKTTLTIKAPAYQSVKLGKNDFISEGNKWVSFTPDETGYYSIKVENSTAGTRAGSPYYMDSNGEKIVLDDDYDDDDYDDNDNVYLSKGVTYYIRVYGYKYDQSGQPVKEPVVISVARAKSDECKYTTTTIPATCTTEGKIIETCQTHEGETITTVIPVKAHTPGAWSVTKEPTAVAEGTQVQKCTVCGNVISTQVIAKLPATLGLNVTAKKTIPLKVKQSFNVKASGFAKGDGVKSWKSSNSKIATVSANGKITGKKAGTATITVTLNSGYTTWFKVKVQKSTVTTSSIKVLNKATGKTVAKKVTLKRKGKLNLTAVVAPVTSKQKVTFTSSKKSVVTVNSKGVVTAKKKGTATITVKSGKKTAKIQITVK